MIATASFFLGSIPYTGVVYFPGPDYMHFVQVNKISRVSAAMREFGLSRIMLRGISYSRTLGAIEKTIRFFDADPWFRDKYGLAIEAGPNMVYATPDGVKILPIWNLASDSALDLKEMAEMYGMVFIRNRVKNFELASRKSDTVARRRVREMWEVVNSLGDAGTRQCKFIIFDYYQLQPNFCMGMSGSAVLPSAGADSDIRVYQLGGRSEPYRPENAERYARELEMPLELAKDPWAVNLRVFQLQPQYLKEFYENIDRFHHDDDKFKTALEASDRVIGKDHWVSTFRSEYVKHRPHANIWSTLGDEKLCNHCSVDFACRYYERGAVCTLPGTEGRTLASLLGSRDSKKVIEGIGKVLTFQAQRFEEAAESEFAAREKAAAAGEPPPPLDPEINKMANDLQKNAKQYATLLNPSLLKPQVNVNIAAGQVGISQPETTPQIMAQAARELEAAGTDRSQITPSMVYEHIARKNGGKIIEGEVIDGIKQDF